MRNAFAQEGKSHRNKINKQRLIKGSNNNNNKPPKNKGFSKGREPHTGDYDMNSILSIGDNGFLNIQKVNLPARKNDDFSGPGAGVHPCIQMERKKSKGLRVRAHINHVPQSSGSKLKQMQKKRDQSEYQHNWENNAQANPNLVEKKILKSNERKPQNQANGPSNNERYHQREESEERNELRSCYSGSINNEDCIKGYAFKPSARRVKQTRITRVDPLRYKQHKGGQEELLVNENQKNIMPNGRGAGGQGRDLNNIPEDLLCESDNTIFNSGNFRNNYIIHNKENKAGANANPSNAAQPNGYYKFFKAKAETSTISPLNNRKTTRPSGSNERGQQVKSNERGEYVKSNERSSYHNGNQNPNNNSYLHRALDRADIEIGKKDAQNLSRLSSEDKDEKYRASDPNVGFTAKIIVPEPPKDIYKCGPWGVMESSFEETLAGHIDLIPQTYRMTIMSDPEKILRTLGRNLDARAVAYTRTNSETQETTLEGVCIYYVDVSSYKNRRVILSHISVVNSEVFEEFLGSATEYIFQNDICSEIFIHLYHNPDINTKKLTCNKEISQIFKNQGYKWKQLVNDANAGTRYP
jgi:hypothetical protein